MNFSLPDSVIKLQDEIIEFANAELNHEVAERDSQSLFSLENWKKCADFGLLGLTVPKEWNGRGADLTTTIAAMEALGYACLDKGLIFAINSHTFTGTLPLLKFGSDEQKAEFLPGMCDGSQIIGNAATELKAGSDVYSMQASAVRQGDLYLINGSKAFVCNGKNATLLSLFASTNPEAGMLGISAFLVDVNSPGVKQTHELEKMGLRTAGTGRFEFDNCAVPSSRLLGAEGLGATIFSSSMEWERGCLLAMHVGNMKRQIELCVQHTRNRKQYGKPIGAFQAVSHRIADMHIRYEAARALVYKIGWLKDSGKSAHLESAVAKVFLSDAAVQSSIDTIQTFGGYGFLTETGVERDLRDAVGSRLYSGTTDIQRNIIARTLGIPANQ